jgi:hypothetical protein
MVWKLALAKLDKKKYPLLAKEFPRSRYIDISTGKKYATKGEYVSDVKRSMAYRKRNIKPTIKVTAY